MLGLQPNTGTGVCPDSKQSTPNWGLAVKQGDVRDTHPAAQYARTAGVPWRTRTDELLAFLRGGIDAVMLPERIDSARRELRQSLVLILVHAYELGLNNSDPTQFSADFSE